MIVYLQMLETAEDRAAFEQLYLTYRSLMYRIAYGILRNQQDAEDAVHQAFLSMIGGFRKINKIECPKTKAFCVIVVERKSLDLLRIRKRDIDSYDVERHGVEIPLPGDNGLADARHGFPPGTGRSSCCAIISVTQQGRLRTCSK